MPSDFDVRFQDAGGEIFYRPRTPRVYIRSSLLDRWNSASDSQRQSSEYKQQIEEYILTKIENGELIQ